MRVTVSGKTIKRVEKLPVTEARWQASQFATIYTRLLILSRLSFWDVGSSPHLEIKHLHVTGCQQMWISCFCFRPNQGSFRGGREGFQKAESCELEIDLKEAWLYGTRLDFPEPNTQKRKKKFVLRLRRREGEGQGGFRNWQSRLVTEEAGCRTHGIPAPSHFENCSWGILNVCETGKILQEHTIQLEQLFTVNLGGRLPMVHFICQPSKRYLWNLRSIKRSWEGWVW